MALLGQRLSLATLLVLCACGTGSGADVDRVRLAARPDRTEWYWVENHLEFKPSLIAKVFIATGNDISSFDANRALALEGSCRSFFYGKLGLLLVMPQSIYLLDVGARDTRLVARAPDEIEFLAATQGSGRLHILGLKKESAFVLIDPGENITELPGKTLPKTFKILVCAGPDTMAFAVSDPGHLFNPDQWDFTGLRFKGDDFLGVNHDVSNDIPLQDMSAVGNQLWLIRKDNPKALRWPAEGLFMGEFPMPPLPQGATHWNAFAQSASGRLELARGPGTYHLSLESGKRVSFAEPRRGDAVGVLRRMFTIQLLALSLTVIILVYLRRRRALAFPIALPAHSLVAHPCGLFRRSTAFWIDVSIFLKPARDMVDEAYFGGLFREATHELLQYTAPGPDLSLWQLQAYAMLLRDHLPLMFESFGVQLGIIALYHGLMEYFFAASLGKMFLNIKVMSEGGGRPRPRQIVIKSVCRFVDYFMWFPLGLIFCWCNRKRKCCGDLLAGTVVVREPLEMR